MNTELKNYIFGQYIGQKVMRWIYPQPPEDTEFTETVTGSMLEAYSHECYLNLRKILAITDSEAVEVAKISYPDYYPNEKEVIRMGKSIVYDLKSELGLGSISWVKAMSLYQYLQQQGFALPVWFKGEFYSVERLVDEEKIIKLTE